MRDAHESRIFNTGTLKGIKDAERFKAKLNNKYESVNVHAIGLDRVQIIGLGLISAKRIGYGG